VAATECLSDEICLAERLAKAPPESGNLPDRMRNLAADGVRRGVCKAPNMLMIILAVLLVLALAGGGWGHSRYGYASWSPVGLIVVVLLVMFFTGNLHT